MRILLLIGLLVIGSRCVAHETESSYLVLNETDAVLQGYWAVPLTSLDKALDLVADGGRDLLWGDIIRNQDRILDYVFSSLQIKIDQEQCGVVAQEVMLEQLSSGLHLYLPFVVNCEGGVRRSAPLLVNSGLLQEENPDFKTLFRFSGHDVDFSRVLTRESASVEVPVVGNPDSQFLHLVAEGVWHILKGFDHLLFLAALLIPIVFTSRSVVRELTIVVSAFTLAHSLTLGLAATRQVVLPESLVESLIALSVVVGAVLGLLPIFEGRRWLLAFGFGLLHGFGFANVLGDLIEPVASLTATLISFNIGVELGQLLVVLAVLPLLMWIKSYPMFSRNFLVVSMIAIGACGSFWLLDRMNPMLWG